MHPLLVIQSALGVVAALILIHLWRAGMPEPEGYVRHGLLFACAMVAFVSIWSTSRVALVLAGVSASATVISLECPERGRRYVHFEYAVDGKSYRSAALDSELPRACDTLRVGSTDSVVYLPGQPEVSAWRSPWPELNLNLLTSISFLIGLPLISLWKGRKRGLTLPSS